jgi:hypothetical protein
VKPFFKKYTVWLQKDFALASWGLLRSGVANCGAIARSLSEVTGKGFKTNDMRVYNLLRNKEFQVDDALWRCHFRLVFAFLEDEGVKPGDRIHVNIDTTSSRDDFLMLCASIRFGGKTLPLYFSMRNYPKYAGRMDHKKFEEAFFRALRHILSKKYKYTIVGDAGFGYERLMDLCKSCGFKYLFRINENLNHEIGEIKGNVKDLKDGDVLNQAFIPAFGLKMNISCSENESGRWLLATDLEDCTAAALAKQYGERHPIERMFKEEKTAGFEIEKSRIKDYQRFQRLYFIVFLAQALAVMIGSFIDKIGGEIKKKLSLIYRKSLSLLSLARNAIDYYTEKALEIFIAKFNSS